jgi:hypothetical protein
MAYDAELANRVRAILAIDPGVVEKAMFGGLAFLINGHLAVSVSRQGGLLLRVDPVRTETYLGVPHVGRFTMRGRELDGWLRVDDGAIDTEEQLRRWVGVGTAYARSLPPR